MPPCGRSYAKSARSLAIRTTVQLYSPPKANGLIWLSLGWFSPVGEKPICKPISAAYAKSAGLRVPVFARFAVGPWILLGIPPDRPSSQAGRRPPRRGLALTTPQEISSSLGSEPTEGGTLPRRPCGGAVARKASVAANKAGWPVRAGGVRQVVEGLQGGRTTPPA